ncbi:uncharacterized protein [Littorina saxatilis]|uniref:Uncharacterized protein n=1 Tax=Littorina saxatilis TaxID=31220 RepID=A0AAN9G036_9CAEN
MDSADNNPTEAPSNGHVMSLQEFEQLPPLMPEDSEELPAMWEDGGRLTVASIENSLNLSGKSVEGQGQWAIVSENSVRILAEDGSSQNGPNDANSACFEERSSAIEQNLSEIYESPFQQLSYATNPHHQPTSHPAAAAATSTVKPTNSHRKTARFNLPDTDEDDSPDHLLSPTWTPTDTNGNEDLLDGNGNEDMDTDTVSENVDPSTVVLAAAGSENSDSPDTNSAMKASIARAALRAVSGYRTCDDADSYVGTRVKPTLILARAPPSPSGILRRTNKKAAAKAGHGSVRWADGRPVPSPEDTIPE